MSRFTNPFPQFEDINGVPQAGGTLSFFETGTTIFKTIFSDADLQTPAANPATLNASGVLDTDVFTTGQYNVVLKNSLGEQKRQADPYSGFETAEAQWSDWDPTITYGIGDLVRGSDGLYYQSEVASNLNNDPVLDPISWSQVQLTTVWNPNRTYSSIDTVFASDGNLYKSKVNNNLGNNPVSSSDEWGPAFNLETTLNVSLPRGYHSGYTLDNIVGDPDHDTKVTAGAWRDFANLQDIIRSTPITKQIDSDWVEGDDVGGFPSGLSLSPNTTYHFFVIVNAAGGVDAGYDSDINATNLLADATEFTGFRRVLSRRTDGSSNLVPIRQQDNRFYYDAPTLEIDDTNIGTDEEIYTIKTPLGIKTIAILSVFFDDNAIIAFIYIHSPDIDNLAPSVTVAPLNTMYNGDAGGGAEQTAIVEGMDL